MNWFLWQVLSVLKAWSIFFCSVRKLKHISEPQHGNWQDFLNYQDYSVVLSPHTPHWALIPTTAQHADSSAVENHPKNSIYSSVWVVCIENYLIIIKPFLTIQNKYICDMCWIIYVKEWTFGAESHRAIGFGSQTMRGRWINLCLTTQRPAIVLLLIEY